MKTQFSIALLATMTMARSLPESEQNEFIGFAAKYNKHYQTTEELADRIEKWHNNKQKVDKMNKDNQGKGVTFSMNETGDLSADEFKKRQGLDMDHPKQKPNKKDKKDKNKNRPDHAGRKLQEDIFSQSINWVTEGHVTPVKSQGSCGSCWAFAATTVQESMQSILNGTAPKRLSEQECVDCDSQSWGCNGGWMSNCWEFSQTNGLQFEEDYPYEAADGACRNQTDKRIASKSLGHGFLDTPDDIAHDLIVYGPVSIAVSAGNDCWQFYESGILSSANNCPTSLDHGVVIVGIDRTGDIPYWIVQNSWDTWWGDNGFIYLAVEEGDGVSGMNLYAEWTDVSS